MCIDATEVTVGQYKEFLADRNGDWSGQRAECEWNHFFEPPYDCLDGIPTGWEPEKHPQECVDWCDAEAFCAWSGKRLCGGIDQRGVRQADLADATKDAWYNACSSGGTNRFPFGNTCNTMPCRLTGNGSNQVPAGYECQASGEYQGVWDLIGNVSEWVDSCSRNPVGSGQYDFCQIRGDGYGSPGVGGVDNGSCEDWDRSSVGCNIALVTRRATRAAATFAVGFRCCAR
jgi:formylglycine-generating enzyme required for sulfatase activity